MNIDERTLYVRVATSGVKIFPDSLFMSIVPLCVSFIVCLDAVLECVPFGRRSQRGFGLCDGLAALFGSACDVPLSLLSWTSCVK